MNQAQNMAFGRRLLVAGTVAILILGLWVSAALMAREILPGTTRLVDRVFVAALLSTYLGGWTIAVVLARLQRMMLFRAVGTTITAVLILALLEVPAAFKLLLWSLVFRSLSGEGAQDYMNSYLLDPELSFRRIPGRRWTAHPRSDIEEGSGLKGSARLRSN